MVMCGEWAEKDAWCSSWEGISGVEVGIVYTKVARQAGSRAFLGLSVYSGGPSGLLTGGRGPRVGHRAGPPLLVPGARGHATFVHGWAASGHAAGGALACGTGTPAWGRIAPHPSLVRPTPGGGASQHVMNFVRPKPITLAPWDEHEHLLLMDRFLGPLEAGWRAALATGGLDHGGGGDPPRPLQLNIIDDTPDMLPVGAVLPLAPPHLPRGRGTDRLLREVRLCLKQRWGTGVPLTCPLARIQAAQGPLSELLCWLERPARGLGAMPHKVVKAWGAPQSGLRLVWLRALGPGCADMEPGGTQNRQVRLQPLRFFHTKLVGMARAGLWVEGKERLWEWRAWLDEAWSMHRPGGPVTVAQGPRRSPSSPGRTPPPRPTWRKQMASCGRPSGR